jgi:hypothetical protein
VMFWDSDVLAVRKFSPSDLMIASRPRCLITPYAVLVDAHGAQATPWKAIVEKALGRHSVEHEKMRQHPFLTHRSALLGVRDYMEKLHGCTLRDYIAAQGREFSEFNVLHSWSYYYAPHFFSFLNTEYGVPEPFVKQYHSWSGLTPEIRAEMERILA